MEKKRNALERQAISLARLRARRIVERRYRDAGRKAQDTWREQRADADIYFLAHRAELMASAVADIKIFVPEPKPRKSTTSAPPIIGAK